ncbi:pentatricopeptide repeat-containing protein, partial [Trifolium medium]|nr:pentatricopeptide repeat-containing protein [Trifolium medium]
IWYLLGKWLGISTAFHNEGVNHLQQFEGLIGNGRVFADRVSVIWFAGIWCIWKARNDKVFKNKEISVDKMVESVKNLSWNWLSMRLLVYQSRVARTGIPIYPLYRDGKIVSVLRSVDWGAMSSLRNAFSLYQAWCSRVSGTLALEG